MRKAFDQVVMIWLINLPYFNDISKKLINVTFPFHDPIARELNPLQTETKLFQIFEMVRGQSSSHRDGTKTVFNYSLRVLNVISLKFQAMTL